MDGALNIELKQVHFICLLQCYYSDAAVADGYFSVLAEVYMRQEIPKCEIQRLLRPILYKAADLSR